MIRNLCRALSPLDEFIIIVVGAFAAFIYASLASILGHGTEQAISGADLRDLVAFEVIVSVPLLSFLHIRGWTIESVGLQPDFRETLVGVGLAVAIQLLTIAIWPDIVTVFHQGVVLDSKLTNKPVDLFATILASVVNPIFEELFVCGYIITALKDRRKLAIFASISIRILYHLYQGVVGILLMLPFALVCTFWFEWKRRLWPLIAAHVIFDFVALSAIIGG